MSSLKWISDIDFSVYDKAPWYPSWLSHEGDQTLQLAQIQNPREKELETGINGTFDEWDFDNLDKNPVLLDRVGRLLNVSRGNLNDEEYAKLVKVKTVINNSHGTVEDIYKVLEYYFGKTEQYRLVPSYPAGIEVKHENVINKADFNSILKQLVGAGIQYSTDEVLFPYYEEFYLGETNEEGWLDLYLGDYIRYDGRTLYDGRYRHGYTNAEARSVGFRDTLTLEHTYELDDGTMQTDVYTLED